MNLHELLRTHALNDLRRLIPHAHYSRRTHSPQADRELTEPLLRDPVRFEMTPREAVAAHALRDLAEYEILSRSILSEAFPAQDVGLTPAETFMTADRERKIVGRWEAFRSSALVYARSIGDEVLIEGFQPLQPAPVSESPAAASTDGARRHSTKVVARDVLDPAIELAQSKCKNAEDAAEVYAQLEALAQVEHPPLLAATSQGLKYSRGGVDAYFTREALTKRLKRRA